MDATRQDKPQLFKDGQPLPVASKVADPSLTVVEVGESVGCSWQSPATRMLWADSTWRRLPGSRWSTWLLRSGHPLLSRRSLLSARERPFMRL
jgi:hypothetical protein